MYNSISKFLTSIARCNITEVLNFFFSLVSALKTCLDHVYFQRWEVFSEADQYVNASANAPLIDLLMELKKK